MEAALAPCQLKLRLCLVSWHGLAEPLQRGSRQQQSPAEASTSSRGRWWCGAASILCVVCTDATACTVLYCTDIQTQDTSRQLRYMSSVQNVPLTNVFLHQSNSICSFWEIGEKVHFYQKPMPGKAIYLSKCLHGNIACSLEK